MAWLFGTVIAAALLAVLQPMPAGEADEGHGDKGTHHSCRGHHHHHPAPRAGRVDSISPACGVAGDRVTLTGQGFGAHNVRIKVGTATTSQDVTF